ncbi:hypothetical protein [Roseicella sp. DB1501]|uniref:hypothetical protein n=1 Tax=Roseicella sp. DB1501 TaxID=2730925 RepID=UPI001492E65C|nr:hypothetical protein [Roseicella sp. DB1501]NOG68953.1 hypothetical protein [Roseicella sp. DB1501]
MTSAHGWPEDALRRSDALPSRLAERVGCGRARAGWAGLCLAAILLATAPAMLPGEARATGALVMVKSAGQKPPPRRPALRVPRILPPLPEPTEEVAVPRITHAFRMAPVTREPRSPCLTSLRRDTAVSADKRGAARRPKRLRAKAGPAVPLCVRLPRREIG